MQERERFVRGTLGGTLGIVVVGLAAFGLARMWGWALGFAAGALVSLGSFELIVASVTRLTEHPAPRPRGRRRWWAWSLIRLLGSATALFLVIYYLPVNLIGVALGLLAVQLGMGGYLLSRLLLPQGSSVGGDEREQ